MAVSKEVIAEMMEEGTLIQPVLMQTPESKDNAQEVQDLGDMMSAFR